MPTSDFSLIRELIHSGDTEGALNQLQEICNVNKVPFRRYQRTLGVLKANFNAIKQQEMKGILSFQESQREINKVNDGLLLLIEEIENPYSSNGERSFLWRNRYFLVAGSFICILVILFSFPFFYNKNAEDCPVFEENKLKVLVLPFQSISGEKAQPENLLLQKIRDLADRRAFPIDAELYGQSLAESSTPDASKARNYALNCRAQVVVWGQYFKLEPDFRISISYLFVDFERRSASSGFENIKGLLGGESGKIEHTLEDATFSLCAILALAENNPTLAKNWLEKIKELSPVETKLLEKLNTL